MNEPLIINIADEIPRMQEMKDLLGLDSPEERMKRKAREIAKKIHPTREGRAFKMIQSDPKGLRAIDTVIPFPSDSTTRREWRAMFQRVVKDLMGVDVTIEYTGTDTYHRVTSPMATATSKAQTAADNNQPLL